VRDELREELALIEAEDRLPTLATQLDDELAAGGGVDEAAEAVGLQARTIDAVDRAGLNPSGDVVEDLAAWSGLVRTAYEIEEGEPSLLEETDHGGYYVVQVDGIAKERVKELDEVRDEVVEVWEEQQRRAGAKARAEEFLAKLQETASLDTLAADDGITIELIEPLKRSADGAEVGINRAAVQALFETEAGKVADEVVEAEDGVIVLANEEVIGKEPGDDQDGFDQLKDELERQARADVLDQFGNALRDSHPIEIDDQVLARLIENDGSAGYGGGAPLPQSQPLF
ncbi:MAG: hypothetical protein ACR2QF_18495, partial [Geminicoccaceae bacterium]